MWMDLALGGVKSIGSYLVASAEAKNKRSWQKYNNTMVMLQGAQNQNTLTDNENMARERSAEEAFLIRRSEYITKASAEVAAAATGTTGRSVNMILFDVGRNAAIADRDRARDLDLQYLGIDNQRKQVALQTKMSLDTTDIPNPNPFSYALDFVGNNSDSLGDMFTSMKSKSTVRNTGPGASSGTTDPWVQNGISYRL